MIKLKNIINEILGHLSDDLEKIKMPQIPLVEIEKKEDISELRNKLTGLEIQLKVEFPELQELNIYPRSNAEEIFLGSIKVKPNYRKGAIHGGRKVGTRVMERITQFADEHNLYISLHPNPERGYKEKLLRFYKSFGFFPNKGRRGISRFGGAFGVDWIRKPKSKVYKQVNELYL